MPNLLWKEWHEQSWKLGFACIVLGAIAFIGFRARMIADETMMMWVCFGGLTLLPVFASAGLVAAERDEGSLESLLSLPIKPAKILAVKAVMGAAICAAPMLLSMAITLFIAGGREIPSAAIAVFYCFSLVTTLSLFAWMFAMTIRLPTEARAALLAVGILILWMMVTAAITESAVWKHVMIVSPFALVYRDLGQTYGMMSVNTPTSIREMFLPVGVAVATQVVIALILWRYASKRLVG